MSNGTPSTPAGYTRPNLQGWINLKAMIGPGDEIVILPDGLHGRVDRVVQATVTAVSSNNLIGVDVRTEGAMWIYGGQKSPLPSGFYEGWLDIMWDIAVQDTPPTGQFVTLMRADGKDWLAQGPFTINLQKENEDCFFGYATEGAAPHWRVWYKGEWKRA